MTRARTLSMVDKSRIAKTDVGEKFPQTAEPWFGIHFVKSDNGFLYKGK